MSTLKVNRIEPRTGDTVEIVGFEAPTTPVKAWVNFDGTGVVSIRDAMNVSSITDNGVGDYTVNFETPMPDADYSVATSGDSALYGAGAVYQVKVDTTTTSTFQIRAKERRGALDDISHIYAIVVG